MKVIDWERKGNAIRLYLGEDSLTTWGGDDWDDYPYEHNAGKVYAEYIAGTYDIILKYDDEVYEPNMSNYSYANQYCKDDLLQGKCPCLVIVKYPYIGARVFDFDSALADKNSIKIYFGDNIEDIKNNIKDKTTLI